MPRSDTDRRETRATRTRTTEAWTTAHREPCLCRRLGPTPKRLAYPTSPAIATPNYRPTQIPTPAPNPLVLAGLSRSPPNSSLCGQRARPRIAAVAGFQPPGQSCPMGLAPTGTRLKPEARRAPTRRGVPRAHRLEHAPLREVAARCTAPGCADPERMKRAPPDDAREP
jgi:hypothetical protein